MVFFYFYFYNKTCMVLVACIDLHVHKQTVLILKESYVNSTKSVKYYMCFTLV